MNIIDSQKYTTRVFKVADGEEIYTLTYKEDSIFCCWEIENAKGDVFSSTSGIGVNLIGLCEQVLWSEQERCSVL